jgi:branched-chain amino acid transport system ATP-binding protein
LLLASEALDRRKFTMHRPLSRCADLVAKAMRVLHEFGLTSLQQERARNLSYGDQRKVEVALSMAGSPRLLLLDEPMAGLSSAESHSMQELLKRLDPSTAVLLIEHDMDIAFGFAERVTVLAQGRILTEGHSREVSANPAVQQIYLGQDL